MREKIVFDLGGVLLDWDPRHLYRQVFDDRADMEYFLSQVCSPAWNAQMDAGTPFQEAVDQLVLRFPHYRDQIRMFDSRWVEMVRGEIPGTVQILRELKEAGYHLAALSNWSLETFPRVQSNYEFLGWFEPLLLSGQLGVAKPAPEIYRALLHRTGWRANDCLFIDDVRENVLEASRQGFDIIHFRSAEQLLRELKEREIL